MSWFFKENVNTSSTGKPVWKDTTFIEPISYACAIGLIILFTILFFVTAPYIWFAFISVFFVMFTLLSYKAVMDKKSIGLLDIFLDVLKFYKMSFVTIICIFIISSAFTNLGTMSGFIGLGILFLIWYGLISFDLLNTIKPSNLTPLVKDEQASRGSCISNSKKEKHGFLYNTIFGEQNGGKNISKQLKKMNNR